MSKPKFNLKDSAEYRGNNTIWTALKVGMPCIKRDEPLEGKVHPVDFGRLIIGLEATFRIQIWGDVEPLKNLMERIPTLNALYDEIEAKIQYRQGWN